MVDQAGVSAAPDAGGAATQLPRQTWGIWASLAWVAAAAFVRYGVVDWLFGLDPLRTLTTGSAGGHAAHLLAVWASELLVIVLAVRLLAVPIAPYLGWIAARPKPIIVGIALVSAMQLAEHALSYAVTGQAYDVSDYRQAIAQGLSPWWFVLKWWPAFICAPIVEESVYRGFLWRGVEASRLGRRGALLVTTVVFAAVHYRYFFSGGEFFAGTLGLYVIWGLIFGALRWRSGGTTVPIIAHSFSNLMINLHPLLLAPFVP